VQISSFTSVCISHESTIYNCKENCQYHFSRNDTEYRMKALLYGLQILSLVFVFSGRERERERERKREKRERERERKRQLPVKNRLCVQPTNIGPHGASSLSTESVTHAINNIMKIMSLILKFYNNPEQDPIKQFKRLIHLNSICI